MQQHVGRIVSALVGLALLGAAVYLIVSGHAEHGAGLLTIAIAVLGAVGTVALPAIAGGKR